MRIPASAWKGLALRICGGNVALALVLAIPKAISGPALWIQASGLALETIIIVAPGLWFWRSVTWERGVAAKLGLSELSTGPAWRLGVEAEPFSKWENDDSLALASGRWRGRPAAMGVLTISGRPGSGTWRIASMSLERALPTLRIGPKYDMRGEPWGLALGSDVEEFEANRSIGSGDLKFARAVLSREVLLASVRGGANRPLPWIDNDVAFIATRGSAWSRGRAVRDLDALADFVSSIPERIYRHYGRDPREPHPPVAYVLPPSLMPYGVALPSAKSRAKDYLVTLSFFCSLFFYPAPLGIFFGHLALRAVARGTASSRSRAVLATVIAYVVTVAMIATVTLLTVNDAWVTD